MIRQRFIRQVIIGVCAACGFIGLLTAQTIESLAILDFEARGVSAHEVATLSERLRSVIVKTGKITVVERGMMQTILQEQDFQLAGCTTSECAVQVGQLLGVTGMVAGSIGKVGETYSIDIRLIDVQTGKINATIIRDYRGQIDGLLAQMGSIALELVNPEGEAPQPVITEVSPVADKQDFVVMQSYAQGRVVLMDGSVFKGKKLRIGPNQFKIIVNNSEQTYNLKDARQLFGKKDLAKKFGNYSAGCCAGVTLFSWLVTGGETTTTDAYGNEVTTELSAGQFFLGSAIWAGVFYLTGYVTGMLVDDWSMVYFDS